jgi:uncharacterized membrane protein YdbT with pleckstrin-like domain
MSEGPSPPEWLELDDDEYLLMRSAPSPNLVLAGLVFGVAMMLAMAVVVGFVTSQAIGRSVSFAVLILIVALLAATYLLTKRREYVVTDRQVCAAVGFLNRDVSACSLENVRDLAVEQTTWQQLFNVGTLRFEADGGAIVFRFLEDPAGVQSRLLEFVDLHGD